MKRTEYGVELNKEESEELMKSGYVVNDDCTLCCVDMDGEYMVFERKPFTQLSIYDYSEVE